MKKLLFIFIIFPALFWGCEKAAPIMPEPNAKILDGFGDVDYFVSLSRLDRWHHYKVSFGVKGRHSGLDQKILYDISYSDTIFFDDWSLDIPFKNLSEGVDLLQVEDFKYEKISLGEDGWTSIN